MVIDFDDKKYMHVPNPLHAYTKSINCFKSYLASELFGQINPRGSDD